MPFINDQVAANKESIEVTNSPQRLSRFTFDPDSVMGMLRQSIVGQDEVLESVGDLLHFIKADIGEPTRPLAVCFFSGKTGVGKTQLAKLLAAALTGKADGLCRIDMNTLAQEHYAASITGAPPGYVGSKDGDTLFDKEKIAGSYSKPGVVLFDEVEKANSAVKRALLNIMDSGYLQLTAGNQSIDFRNSLILFTSNVGAKEIQSYQNRFDGGWRKALGLKPSRKKEVELFNQNFKSAFDPEFINRIDYLFSFNAITSDALPSLLAISIEDLKVRLSKKSVALTIEHEAKQLLLSKYNPEYGARDFVRRIRTYLEPRVARVMNNHPLAKELRVVVQNRAVYVILEGGLHSGSEIKDKH
ncbi:AAA family ATPase [Marinomonas sp. C2222]|uniref:AAA family ATPase n=1 Tax=Marinomonas sargassi TaxID=2984494 RepID=A0ABT2YUQ5_9GAMM|nr:AAA family ATPase [Marinomonas sargassi]MCV2403490.1 AAA family ATPase [Marinomonas sargassi]